MYHQQPTFAAIPNLQLALKKLVLIERLREEANIDTLIGFSIVRAINSNKLSDTKILETVKSQAKDNQLAMELVIGSELTELILNINL